MFWTHAPFVAPSYKKSCWWLMDFNRETIAQMLFSVTIFFSANVFFL